MESEDLIDEKALIERIRERLRTPLDGAPMPPLAPRPVAPVDRSPETLDSELAMMAAAADVGHVRLRSYRKLLGPLLTFARRVTQKLVAGPLEQQIGYNTANYRLARALREELVALRGGHEALRAKCEALEAVVERMRTQAGTG